MRHSVELQSLRGLAALVVLLSHSLRSMDSFSVARFVSDNILNPHAAVVIFFVLSGYVLALSLERRGVSLPATVHFYVRRAFRIIPALYPAMAIGLLYLIFFRAMSAPHMLPIMTVYYDPALMRPGNVIMSLIGLDGYLLPTAWTITIELMVSALLPAFVLFATRLPRVYPLLVMILAAISFYVGPHLRSAPLYLVDFALGVLLATSRPLSRLVVSAPVALLALLPLGYFRLLAPRDYHDPLYGLVEAFASTVVIAAIVQGRATWLRNKHLVTLGDWSYSIYLLHLPIMLIATRLVNQTGLAASSPTLCSVIVAASTLGATLPLAALVYRYVELPGIALGEKVARAVRARIATLA